MTKRTDTHAPNAQFDPAQYDYTGAAFDWNPEWPHVNADAYAIQSALIAAGRRFTGVHGAGRCDHCGTYLRYAILLEHRATKGLLYVGERCAANRFEGTKADFAAMRKRASEASKAAAKLASFTEQCAEHPDLAYATYADNIVAPGAEWQLDRLADVARKARTYGGATPGQLAFVGRLLGELEAKVAEHAEREAAKAARPNAWQAKVGERLTFTGTVRFTREWFNNFGGVTTLLVLDTPGGAVKWFASRGLNVRNGETVTLKGTVKAHDDYQGEKSTVVSRCTILD